ncbi:uncharacterized protein DS421_11g341880 [Arachis hypogaea]|nr:uncharacterized protein DS421_11g341880 [Arachis hypogaea]
MHMINSITASQIITYNNYMLFKVSLFEFRLYQRKVIKFRLCMCVIGKRQISI